MELKNKLLVATLAGSLFYYHSKVQWEGEVLKPYWDSVHVATIGIGSTVYPPDFRNGAKVKITDAPITHEEALRIAKWHTAKDEEFLRKSLPNVLMTQREFDVALDFAYNFGRRNWERSRMRKELLLTTSGTDAEKLEHYQNACKAYLRYRFAGGKDCSKAENQRNCGGVWKRAQWRSRTCMIENS